MALSQPASSLSLSLALCSSPNPRFSSCSCRSCWRCISCGVRTRAYANWLLLVASVIFYAKGGGAFTWLMLGSIAFNYWMAIAVDRVQGTPRCARASRSSAVAVAVNLVVLGIFKYANFFADNVNALLPAFDAPPLAVPRVLLPIGISFFTFHAISYVVDVYRGDATAQKSPVHAALYLLLFPQLIAGPIIRYRDIADQLARRVVTLDDFADGVRRFVIGLGKKVLIANVVAGPRTRSSRCRPPSSTRRTPGSASSATRCRSTSTSPATPTWRSASAGCSASAFRRTSAGRTSPTRCRSSGGAGTSRCRPGFATTSTSRSAATACRRPRMYVNLVTVFFLCGLWHGASWNFVIWGLFHGTLPGRRAARPRASARQAALAGRFATSICCWS